MTPRVARFYWDACAWIGFINREAKKIHPLQSIWADAEAGKCEIWTSSYSYIEVIKGALKQGELHHDEESDGKVDSILSQPWVRIVQLDSEVAKLARRLRRDLAKIRNDLGLKDPLPRPDAIHLASAAFYDCDELHTWDAGHLIGYSEKVSRNDGSLLKIRVPGPEVDGPLFEADAALTIARQRILTIIKRYAMEWTTGNNLRERNAKEEKDIV